MKKLLSVFAALMIIFTFSLQSFAADTSDTIDTSNWITHEIPELGISLALPQGTKVYTRDCLSDENLKNDPNFERVKKYFSLDSRYCLAINEEENLSLDLKMNYVIPPLPYPYDSFDHLSDEFLDKLIHRFNSNSPEGPYFFLLFNSHIFLQYPPVFQSIYVYHLYNCEIANIDYDFDFRLKADEGIERPSAMYDAILSTVDFSNAHDHLFSHIYEFILAAIVAVIAIFVLVKFQKSNLDPKL